MTARAWGRARGAGSWGREEWAPGWAAARCPPPGAAEAGDARDAQPRDAGTAAPGAGDTGSAAERAQAWRPESQEWKRGRARGGGGGGGESPQRPLAGFPPARGPGRRERGACAALQPGLRREGAGPGGRRLGPAGGGAAAAGAPGGGAGRAGKSLPRGPRSRRPGLPGWWERPPASLRAELFLLSLPPSGSSWRLSWWEWRGHLHWGWH